MSNKEGDPLNDVHNIQKVLLNARPIANAMLTLGMSRGEDLHMVLDRIDELAQSAAKGICQEAHQRYTDATQATNNMLRAALAVAGEVK